MPVFARLRYTEENAFACYVHLSVLLDTEITQ